MDYLNTEENKSRKEALRNNYQSLSEVTRLLLKQVDQLSQAFKAMNLPDKTDETNQLLEKRISEALDICDILRSAADLGKSPNEMIGYYLLGAKQQAKDFNVRASEPVKVVNDHLLLEVGHSENSEMAELSLEARLYAENQREEIANQVSLVEGNIKIRKKKLVPLIQTKRNELHALEETLNCQIEELRNRFDYIGAPKLEGEELK